MKMISYSKSRAALVIALMLIVSTVSSGLRADSGNCGGATTTLPFTDVMGNLFFCEIAEAFFSGLTNGTSPTTYSPAENVPREQMAAFITRTMDQTLNRDSKRAALDQFWTPTATAGLSFTAVGDFPALVASDGADLWVSNEFSNTVSRVRASDGKRLQTWTNAASAVGVLVAKGLIFVTGSTNPGAIYQIDPTQSQGAVTSLSSDLGAFPESIAFDGSRIWTAGGSSVSIVTLNPLSVTIVTAGFANPGGILYDGANMWVVNESTGKLLKLDSNGAIIQTVGVGELPVVPVFDGTNIWVPNAFSDSVTVVRAATGTVIATLTGNGLAEPLVAAFDGQRILVTNFNGNLSLWRASDLSPIGSVNAGAGTRPAGVCSDGLNFWIALSFVNQLARF